MCWLSRREAFRPQCASLGAGFLIAIIAQQGGAPTIWNPLCVQGGGGLFVGLGEKENNLSHAEKWAGLAIVLPGSGAGVKPSGLPMRSRAGSKEALTKISVIRCDTLLDCSGMHERRHWPPMAVGSKGAAPLRGFAVRERRQPTSATDRPLQLAGPRGRVAVRRVKAGEPQ
jgi:hypothetical protein